MRNVSDDVKNRSFSPIYLIYGEEGYLRENYKNTLIKALVAPGDNLNYNLFSGGSTDPNEVLSIAETLPFMADKRVVLVSESGFFKKSVDQIVDYIKEPAQDTVLIFVESEVDKRGKGYAAAKKAGYEVEAERYGENKLPNWIAANFKRFGKKISKETVDMLIDRVGIDMSALDMEIRKLASHAGDRDVITLEDVMMLVHRNPDSTVYQMIDAIADRRLNKAIGIYYDMLAERESPFGILTLMERQYRIMLVTKDMGERKASNQEIAAAAKISEKIVWKYANQARKYTRSRLVTTLDSCVAADRDIKLGKIADNVAVELVIYSAAE